jgi:hypothetical protein
MHRRASSDIVRLNTFIKADYPLVVRRIRPLVVGWKGICANFVNTFT